MTSDSQVPNARSRILDNTLPQSAAHFINYGSNQALDITARQSFGNFVDAYVNTPNRQVALPAKAAGSGDSFVQLWQDGAEKIINAGPPLRDPQQEYVLNAYANSLMDFGPQWAGFLAFQFTDKIGFQYRSRVPDWQARLERATEQIKSASQNFAAFGNFQSQVLAEKAVALREAKTEHRIDKDYIGWQHSRGIDLFTLMTAYGLDWFQRGYSYSQLTATWWGFHELRRDAAHDMADQAVSMSIQGDPEVAWSHVLIAYLDRGILPADDIAIAQLLAHLRSHVQSSDFAESWQDASSEENSVQRSLRTRDVIVDTLMKVGIYPQKRTSGSASQIDALTEILPPLMAVVPDPASLIVRFGGELVKMANQTSPGAKIRFKVHRRLRPQTIWRAYEIPGLTTPMRPW
jgi:hypothetical protein